MKDNNYKKSKKHFKKAPRGGEPSLVDVNDKFAHIQPVQAQPLEVKVYHGNFDKALRAFRALVQKERILSIYKEKQSYEKPSDKRRRKRNEMKRKRLEMSNPAGNYSTHEKERKDSYKTRRHKSDVSPE